MPCILGTKGQITGYEFEEIVDRLKYPMSQLKQLLPDSERDYWEGYVDAICDLFPDAYDLLESQKETEDY